MSAAEIIILIYKFKKLMCYNCASNLFKKRLMLKYAKNKNTDYHDLTRFNKAETCRIETQFIYINCFNLHVFLSFLILIY